MAVQVNAPQAPVADGSVRERLNALANTLDDIGRGLSQLTGQLAPVLRPIPPTTSETNRLQGGTVSRAPQCDLAVRVDAAGQVARDLVDQTTALLNRLEV